MSYEFEKVRGKKGWYGEPRRHSKAALKGIRNREFKKIVKVGFKYTPLGSAIEKGKDTKTVVKSVKRIADTY